MRYALWTLIAIVALVGVVAVIGWMLPVSHIASRTAEVRAAPEVVFDLVQDVGGYPAWRADVTKVEILDSGGAGVRFREHSSDGVLLMEMTEAVRPARVVTRIADPSQPFGGTWTFDIVATDGGSAITITEHGEVYSPIFRFVARFVFGHHRTIDRFLGALRRRLEPVG